jgi:hypothetical protein
MTRKTSLGPDLRAQEENVDIAGPRRQVGLKAAGLVNSVENRADQKYCRYRLAPYHANKSPDIWGIIVDKIDRWDYAI